MQRYSVSELAFGGKGKRTETVCVLADIRGNDQARPSMQVWSYGRNKTIHLPRTQIQNMTPSAVRWAAISLPRWLANNERLWDLPPIDPDDVDPVSERATAEYVVARQMKYVLKPGERLSLSAYGGAA